MEEKTKVGIVIRLSKQMKKELHVCVHDMVVNKKYDFNFKTVN